MQWVWECGGYKILSLVHQALMLEGYQLSFQDEPFQEIAIAADGLDVT